MNVMLALHIGTHRISSEDITRVFNHIRKHMKKERAIINMVPILKPKDVESINKLIGPTSAKFIYFELDNFYLGSIANDAQAVAEVLHKLIISKCPKISHIGEYVIKDMMHFVTGTEIITLSSFPQERLETFTYTDM